uniref:Coenzyme Q-binding protein COQ10 START domain-containing protein n=1 Tax=Oryza brachyantha TaxID=4533 RepID=J3KZE1_ORYBR
MFNINLFISYSLHYELMIICFHQKSTEIEVDVPCSVAYQCYSERETIPQWMPFISSVKVLEDKPDLSRWTLKYEILGRNVEFSWLARNMTPTKNQKIHWRSLEGLPNRGAVRFFPKSSSSCRVQLTVAYEVPEILAPVASALKPFLEGLLMNGLERFATYARERHTKIPRP